MDSAVDEPDWLVDSGLSPNFACDLKPHTFR